PSIHLRLFYLLVLAPPPRSTLFPYTTLFRSTAHGPTRRHPWDRSRRSTEPWSASRMVATRAGRSAAVHIRIDLGRRSAMYALTTDRKSTRLNSSHVKISYAVFCLKKKKRAST